MKQTSQNKSAVQDKRFCSAFFKKRTAGGIKLTLTFLFLAGALVYVHNAELRVGLQLVLRVNVPHSDIFQLFIDGKEPQKVKVHPTPAGSFHEIRFLLPRDKIENLRLNLGQKPATIAIKDLTIQGLFRSGRFKLAGKQLQKLFQREHLIDKSYTRGNSYYVESGGQGNWIAPGSVFYRIPAKLQSRKTFYYLLCILLSLVFFYFLHFLNIRGLRQSLAPRVIVNGVLVFILIISFPLTNRLLMISGQSQLVEKRRMTRKLEFRLDSLFAYLKRYTNYYNDHFTFRSRMIYLNNLFKVNVLGVSPLPKVLIGKNGWLFMGPQELRPGTIESYRSLTPFTISELEQWKNLLEHRKQWLAARGIRYLFLVAPNKNSIYPEYMPDNIRRVHRQSRMDQLKEYLAKHSTVPLLDVREALRAAKKNYPVYSRTDTHWNEYGAYIVHREIIGYISRYFKGAVPIPISRYRIKTENWSGGDLAQMLSLHEEVFREDFIRLEPVPGLKAAGGELENISRFVKQGYMECPDAPLPKMMMVHDSFYKRLKPFLAERFSRILFIWDWDFNFYPRIIEKEKPKLLIDEMAERFLMGRIPINPETRKKKTAVFNR